MSERSKQYNLYIDLQQKSWYWPVFVYIDEVFKFCLQNKSYDGDFPIDVKIKTVFFEWFAHREWDISVLYFYILILLLFFSLISNKTQLNFRIVLHICIRIFHQ